MSASTADNSNNNDKDDVSPDICANCGKGEENGTILKACTACKMVKYCNRECQIAHRPQHKKACKKRAAELHDEKLFRQPPPQEEDCPICFLRMPYLETGKRYMSCCGKTICSGCIHTPVYDHEGNVVDDTCPFCRSPPPTSEQDEMQRIQKLVEAGNAKAVHMVGVYYDVGMYGLHQDYAKALEFYHRAAKLGHATSYYQIGVVNDNGRGVEVDKKKARHYYELAAMRGDKTARYNLGASEENAGNVDRALKHYMIAVRDGEYVSLETIRKMIKIGRATKDDYAKALRSYQSYLDEVKSDQRDKAAAAREDHKYID